MHVIIIVMAIGGILSINMVGGSIIMHEASHTHDKLGAISDIYELNLTRRGCFNIQTLHGKPNLMYVVTMLDVSHPDKCRHLANMCLQ